MTFTAETTDATAEATDRPGRADGDPAEIGAEDELVTEELLVEEISIDGMCGVY